MRPTPGTTLGPYRVAAKIGEGDMGEVYRARDTKLDKDLALNQVRHVSLLVAASLVVGVVGCGQVPSLPDDGFVEVIGGRIAYHVVGAGDGVPVLVIHGGPGGSSCSYQSTLTGIAAERPVVMYDQLGSGQHRKRGVRDIRPRH